MPDREKEEEVEFKVVDRRPFTSEGDRRADLPPEPASPEPPLRPEPPREQARQSAAGGKASAAERGRAGQEAQRPAPGPAPGPVQFEHLVMSLVTSAMLQLGMAGQPGEPPPPPDLPAAQETIDLLAMLQQKTQGNLTPAEDELLTGSLAELRLAFVELSRRAASRIR